MTTLNKISCVLSAVLVGVIFQQNSVAQCSVSSNLVSNGSFESGNTGFTSSYGYSAGNLVPEAKYDVLTNPRNDHASFAACGDKTSGSGKMMVVNGAPTAGVNVWCSTVAVSANSDYVFSTYVTSVHTTSPATLQFSINGINLGSTFSASSTTCTWLQFCETWNSGAATSAQICIVNQNTAATGNDFALDDIKMGIVAPLYVEMTSFNAQAFDTYAQLEWATVTEINHDYFSIERSADAENWESIGVVEGKGNSNGFTLYQYLDLEPNGGKNYYRIKMVDMHGVVDFSEIKYVHMNENYAQFKIYPNPTFNTVHMYGAKNIDQIKVVNALGYVVYNKKLDVLQEDIAMDFSALGQGVFLVKLLNNKEEVVYSSTLVKK